ncbi:hypothetical protein ND861_05675 [Leptospira sp. 2 VSF19]|uniref:DUF5683 domain-containing protein n=1 Tax=Leptospira soteropolitanensis TaxID=2950025 RepID=A0AAW5VI63_9LEPT|nr:hypothetical protein [Leptospira soteropolitanensis]MCW7492143.1 hypothetical protein [Leptospira soteropolitanensis]MCW7499725.1 hypothetical protein [Leptospira soteropolitanensis]MCW7521976.1 hypothetical protein [Leptospira soteropolitanensis]MCW7525830.1 hypothetical protein [Leptospira soteropolitanensis]MCW7530056.1 hypothetical protein [Leptospira soteropolitanensis]
MVLGTHISFPSLFRVTSLVCFAVACITSLSADRIRLKSGEVLNGKVVNVTVSHVEWQDQGKRYKFLNTDVLGIDVGYDGLPACADYKTFGVEDCDLILTKLTKTSASFSKKSSPLELETIPLKKISTLQVNSDSGLPMERYIDSGVRGKWVFGDKEILGVFKSLERGKITIESESKTIVTFDPLDFKSLEIQNKSVIVKVIKEETPKVIPGYSPIAEKKYGKAAFVFGGALLSGLGMLYEYNASVNAINKDIEYIPSGDGRVFIFANTLSTDHYDFHRQRFLIYSAVFTAIISYSLIDSFYLGSIETKKESNSGVYLKPYVDMRPNLTRFSGIWQPFQKPNDSMFYGFSFESRF